MTEETFWELIEAAGREARGRAGAQADLLVARLGEMTIEEIVSFAQWFKHMTERANTGLMLAAHYLVSDRLHSADGFEYFRGWLVGRGELLFKAALTNPDTIADLLIDEVNPGDWTDGEPLIYVGQRAARDKVGEDAYESDLALYDAMHDQPPGLIAEQERVVDDPSIEDDEAAGRLPRLAARAEAIWARFPGRPKDGGD